ncbi:MAG: hypothetical protein ABIA63_00885 [bacterium]
MPVKLNRMDAIITDKRSNLILFLAGALNMAVGIIMVILGLEKQVDIIISLFNILSFGVLCLIILGDILSNKIIISTIFILGFLFSFVFTWFLMEAPRLIVGTFLIAVSAVLMFRAFVSRRQVNLHDKAIKQPA